MLARPVARTLILPVLVAVAPVSLVPAVVRAAEAPADAMQSPRAVGTSSDEDVALRRGEAKRLTGKPEAVTVMLGLLEQWSEVDDRDAIRALLDEVSGDPRQLPVVRGRAGFLRSIVDERLGDLPGARKRRAALGFIADWLVLGPFDNEGKAGDRATLAPEADLGVRADPDKPYAGKAGSERPVKWRPIAPRLLAQGMVPLDAVLRPDQHVLAYATTYVKADKPGWVAVRAGSSGAIKVWLNAGLVLERDQYRPTRVDQDAALVWLPAGWNRLTVKVGAQEGGFSFFLRLTAPDGSPIGFVSSSEGGPIASVARGAKVPPAPALVELGALLKREVDSGSAQAARAYGLFLHYVSPLDPSQGEAERVLKFAAEAQPGAEAWRLVALAATDPEKRRHYLEQATAPEWLAKATPVERARVLNALADAYSRLRRERRAEALWREALAASADYLPTILRLADLAADRGLPARAEAMLGGLAKKHPALSVARALASLADRRGRREEAETRYRAIAEASRDDATALRELFSYARSRGDVDGALGLLDRLASVRAEVSTIAIDRAELLDGIGRSAEAHEALRTALLDCPDEARLLERDGKVLHRLGRDAEAIVSIKRALELRPQNPELRAYLGRIEAGDKKNSADDLARAWSRPVEPMIEAVRADKEAASAKGPARVLLDLSVTRVHANGLSESFSQRVVEILDDRGAREAAQSAVRYTPDTQSVEIKAARVYKKSGEVVEAPGQTDQDTSEPWYGLYYDTRAQVVEFPGLKPGDVVDFEYVVSDVANRNMFADYFGELHGMQEDIPRRESEYVLITPRARAFYFNEPRLPGLRRTEEDKGDERIYRFHADHVPKIDAEPGMPGFTGVAAYLHVSTYKTWEDVARWYVGLVTTQLKTDDSIKAAVREAVKGEKDERRKIQAIYDLVVKQTRYVGLEFGIHGYKPYAVTQVFQRKFGDCKDKASLLVAMLREIGVEATLVLARTRRNGDIDPFPASLAPFDHAIAYVPKYDLFLDGTAEFSGSGELPASDQDIPVLIVEDPRAAGKGRLTRTPVLPVEANRVARDVEVKVADDGTAEVTLRMSVAGQSASEWRNHYQNPGERRERFEKAENGGHPGARVEKVEFPSLEDLEKPVSVEAALVVPAWGRPQPGGELAMPALGREAEMLRSYARLSTRRHDLVLGYPFVQDDRVRVRLPDGFAPKRLPEAKRVESPFGSFNISAERKGAEILVSAALRLTRHRIAAADYPAFRKFCLDVDAAMGQRLVLAHE